MNIVINNNLNVCLWSKLVEQKVAGVSKNNIKKITALHNKLMIEFHIN